MNLLIHYMRRRPASSRPGHSFPVSQTRRSSSRADINKGKDVDAQSMTFLFNIDYTTDYNSAPLLMMITIIILIMMSKHKKESNKLKIQATQGHGTCFFTSHHDTPWSSLSSYYIFTLVHISHLYYTFNQSSGHQHATV